MNNYLVHHGILGQKWGVRRFQNEDGTLTEAGKKRYYDPARGFGKKKMDAISAMSDEELSARLNRAKAEKQYAEITEQLYRPVDRKAMAKAERVMDKLLMDPVLNSTSRFEEMLMDNIYEFVNEYFGGKIGSEFGKTVFKGKNKGKKQKNRQDNSMTPVEPQYTTDILAPYINMTYDPKKGIWVDE